MCHPVLRQHRAGTDDWSGTTFVELIKRSGTHLGVIVTGGRDTGRKKVFKQAMQLPGEYDAWLIVCVYI